MAATTIEHGPQIDYLLRKTQLLVKEPRIDVWLARVLINELLWGKQKISIDRERSVCRPIETILKYEEVLRDELKNISKADIDGAATKKGKFLKSSNFNGCSLFRYRYRLRIESGTVVDSTKEQAILRASWF